MILNAKYNLLERNSKLLLLILSQMCSSQDIFLLLLASFVSKYAVSALDVWLPLIISGKLMILSFPSIIGYGASTLKHRRLKIFDWLYQISWNQKHNYRKFIFNPDVVHWGLIPLNAIQLATGVAASISLFIMSKISLGENIQSVAFSK